MDGGSYATLARAVATVGLLSLLGGCDPEPCGSLDLRAEDPIVDEPAIVAVSDNSQVTIARPCADDLTSACIEKTTLTLRNTPNQLLLSGSGRWLVVRDQGGTYRFDLLDPNCIEADNCTPHGIVLHDGEHSASIGELIGTLRGGDWIVLRSSPDRELWAVYVGAENIDDEDIGDEDIDDEDIDDVRLGSGLDLRVAAMGHRHVIARRILGDDREELYLLRVAPAYRPDVTSTRGEALLLGTGHSFQRVVMTEGPSPAESGFAGPNEEHPDVGTDTLVIATSGRGSDARTLIWSVADLGLTANFAGEVVTKHAVLEDVPGLSPISPDGSHVAYIAPTGALKLRDLESRRSCTVRSSTGATHLLAGFARDATLYFEAAEDRPGPATHKSAISVEIVHAYDPETETFTELTPVGELPERVWRLKAVPPRVDDGIPWAVVANSGDYVARSGRFEHLDVDEVSYVPRSNGELWAIEAKSVSRSQRSLRIHNINPATGDPLVELDALVPSLEMTMNVCLSTSQAGTRTTPWATQCSAPSEPDLYLDHGVPEDELR